MLSEEQPTIPTTPPNGSRPAPMGWQAPSVEEMQSMLPQYEIMEILGRGGMGAVYKGRQKSLKRLVAIKILPLDAADDEMKFVERFQNEAQTMAAMNHPAIVSVHDFGETPDGLLYFIMEFVDGTDVQKMIQASGRLTEEHALAITAHVCDALSYAHKRGVIHRDIKPANILIDQEGHIKVADFGLAKMHDPSQTSGLTKTNMAMGTPDYVAPEVLRPGMVADHRADLYAVGVMLYQMLTGEVPRGMFKLPSQTGIGSDERFDDIICKALEPKPENRYQSAMDVRKALDVILTTPQPKDDGTGIVSVSQIPQKPAQKAAAAPKKQSPATLWLSIGGTVTVLGLASFFALGGKSEPAARVQPVSASPVDAAFLAEVAAAPAARQVELVEQKIEALNDTKVSAEPTITGEKLTGLRLFRADDTEGEVPDVTPLAALKDLDSLHLQYLYPTDISCLRGLKLVNLRIWGGNFNDLSVLQSHPLQRLSLKQTQVSDFSMLKDKALQDLDLEWCHRLSDLSFIKGLPIKYLNVTKTKVHDLSPIAGLPLVELVCDPDAKLDPALLASIPTLKKINLKPVSEWQGGSSNMPPSATLDKGVRTTDPATVVDATKQKAGKIDGKWRDGIEEWIAYREGNGWKIDLEADETGRQVVQNAWIDMWLPAASDEQSPLDGSIRAKGKGGKFRLSVRTNRVGVPVCYTAGFDYNTLKIWKAEGEKLTMLPGADYLLPGKFDPSAFYELEFRATGNLLELFLNGEPILKGHDPSPVPGRFRFGADKGVVVESLETRIDGFGDDNRMQGNQPASRAPVKTESSSVSSANPSAPSPTSWTDWLGPRLAKGQYQGNGFIHEKDGITTDLGMKGTNITADDTMDGAIKLTYLLRDSKGAQITVRNRGTGPTRELYVVEDSGSGMYIGRVLGDKTTMLVSEKYPATFSSTGERTLEFRAEGASLVATVNGTFTVSAHDTTLTKGPSSFVIMKGLLLKKVEVQVLKKK